MKSENPPGYRYPTSECHCETLHHLQLEVNSYQNKLPKAAPKIRSQGSSRRGSIVAFFHKKDVGKRRRGNPLFSYYVLFPFPTLVSLMKQRSSGKEGVHTRIMGLVSLYLTNYLILRRLIKQHFRLQHMTIQEILMWHKSPSTA
ncbi:Uncharacterized protein Adt_28517 [Abeliophyllum distichum]|uniref:Uncharacterized protein n=1 Tax=Abeliophyllum distichum TaxID=126358 RepID=A0ABD1RWS0_9LAMI